MLRSKERSQGACRTGRTGRPAAVVQSGTEAGVYAANSALSTPVSNTLPETHMRCNADGLEAGSNGVPVQPFGKRTGFQARHIDLVMPKPKLLDEPPGFAINFALPDDLAVMVEHVNSRFLQRNVEPTSLRMVRVSMVVGCKPSGQSGRRPITPSHSMPRCVMSDWPSSS